MVLNLTNVQNDKQHPVDVAERVENLLTAS